MRRMAMMLLVAGSLCCGGCMIFTDIDKTPKWSAEQWEKAKQENRDRLAGEDKPESLLAYGGTKAAYQGAGNGITWLWDTAWGNTASRAVRRMHNMQDPDMRREGIYFFADHGYGRQDPYLKRYEQIATTDSDYTVRAIAIRAMNRSRDKRGVPLYLKALEDENAMVRQEAAKALANIPDPQACRRC